MNKIYIVCLSVQFILLVYLFSLNTANVNKLNELEGRIKKIGTATILPSGKVDQVQPVRNGVLKDEPEQIRQGQIKQIVLDTQNDQIKQMINEAVQRHFQKESENKKALGIYNSVNFLAKVLELTETQKDEFWLIMVEFYEGYQRIQDTFKGVDKTSRDSYRYQLEQLKASIMQRLKTILSSQQMEGLQIHLPE